MSRRHSIELNSDIISFHFRSDKKVHLIIIILLKFDIGNFEAISIDLLTTSF